MKKFKMILIGVALLTGCIYPVQYVETAPPPQVVFVPVPQYNQFYFDHRYDALYYERRHEIQMRIQFPERYQRYIFVEEHCQCPSRKDKSHKRP